MVDLFAGLHTDGTGRVLCAGHVEMLAAAAVWRPMTERDAREHRELLEDIGILERGTPGHLCAECRRFGPPPRSKMRARAARIARIVLGRRDGWGDRVALVVLAMAAILAAMLFF